MTDQKRDISETDSWSSDITSFCESLPEAEVISLGDPDKGLLARYLRSKDMRNVRVTSGMWYGRTADGLRMSRNYKADRFAVVLDALIYDGWVNMSVRRLADFLNGTTEISKHVIDSLCRDRIERVNSLASECGVDQLIDLSSLDESLFGLEMAGELGRCIEIISSNRGQLQVQAEVERLSQFHSK